ncbi:MAG: sigma-70 family RNA polymerase sigma factor [Deltaproteobacteria bacterium]|nr:sigma-70 family RNA polymerase sigma factor [Deltaproteobacteria bacterium]
MDRRRAIERARRGDEKGFDWLFHRYRASLFAFIRKTYRLEEAAAADALQNTFIRAFRALGSLEDDDRFEPWMISIARHESLRIIEKRKSDRALPLEADVACERQAQLEQQHDIERLRQLIRDVADSVQPAVIRETAQLYYFSEHRTTTEDLARKLGVPHATVRKRLYAFRAKLKTRLLAEVI